MSAVRADDRAAVLTRNRLAGGERDGYEAWCGGEEEGRVSRELYIAPSERDGDGGRGGVTHIVLPRSRKSAPGLQSLIDSSRHLRAVRMSRCESSSTRPTGYVSLRSAWNPVIHGSVSIRDVHQTIRKWRTVFV